MIGRGASSWSATSWRISGSNEDIFPKLRLFQRLSDLTGADHVGHLVWALLYPVAFFDLAGRGAEEYGACCRD